MYIRLFIPSGREQMALICSDRDRTVSRKKRGGLTTEMRLCDIRLQIRQWYRAWLDASTGIKNVLRKVSFARDPFDRRLFASRKRASRRFKLKWQICNKYLCTLKYTFIYNICFPLFSLYFWNYKYSLTNFRIIKFEKLSFQDFTIFTYDWYYSIILYKKVLIQLKI